MKILILSGDFPPMCSGLGDHSLRLALELRSQGNSVKVGTANAPQESIEGISTFKIEEPWNWKTIRQAWKNVDAWNPDLVIIQYTPQNLGRGPLGIGLLLPFSLGWIRFKTRKPFVLIAHELNYPLELSLRGMLIGIPHCLQLLFWCCIVDKVFCSMESFKKRLAFFNLTRRKIEFLPVGANIEPLFKATTADIQKWRSEFGIGREQKVLLHFGGLHPTHLYDRVFLAADEVREKLGEESFLLICIGIEKRKFETSDLMQGRGGIPSYCRVLGYLDSKEVSKWFAVADLVLAPFMDGISTRRGSVMAAFAHGKPVLTTWGSSSLGSIRWGEFCVGVPVEDTKGFARKAAELVQDPEKLEVIGRSAGIVYREKFSWPVLVQFLLRKIFFKSSEISALARFRK